MAAGYKTIIKRFTGSRHIEKAEEYANQNNLRIKSIAYMSFTFLAHLTVVYEKEL